ncbi:hypothetical protein Pla123a_44550 [Posidoniimonas polymericola]|uniref:Uncharacterized protein n=1 Tax=Posidoniimonas polymericola TaxID=2528002 RepID=A0A5C5XYL0_9BACT|nr:hypothetical protein [Posidoniimonas polymericola]TWT67025.1 hypothetical protein Pla123a_44550 [Posidoniimonas polymericola]
MPSDDFPNAPDMGQEFSNNRLTPAPDKAPVQPPQQPGRDPNLDHLELTLDYTPGGELEQDVHTQLSNQGRSEYLNRTQRSEKPPEQQYLDQIQDRFNKEAEQEEREQEAKHRQDERDAKLLKTLEEKQQQGKAKDELNAHVQGKDAPTHSPDPSDRKASSYDMPDHSDPSDTPNSPPPNGGARPRPGRSERSGPDRSGGGHER